MKFMDNDYVERVYSGLLGKIIGVRHGAPIEGWTYDRIKKVYGEIDGYLVDYQDFAADDDTNGPVFFLRALEDYTYTRELTAEQIGLTWLNYTPYEHGFYWWGGYGVSTEHTAYLNLANGIMAPRSGSIAQNGAAVAEQIGGQIFIDFWGLIAPGNPKLAAEYAKKAASVSHDRNGVYGGMFIAACISAAFVEQNIEKIIEIGLSVIPDDCEYTRVCRDVIKFYKDNPHNWKDCYKFVKDNYGYDRYPGACHIIPNSALIVLSLLYSEGDFSKAINICNMAGWDTDCNVANVGTIMGVRNGLEGIDYDKWIKPINDFLACSSVIGSLNILDIPWIASYIAKFGYKIAGVEPPEKWQDILSENSAKFHFEYPGSTHGFRVSSDISQTLEYDLRHTVEEAHSGTGWLKVIAKPIPAGSELRVYHKTYYRPDDFHDSRYDPCFSPILYPGQTVKGSIMVPEFSDAEVLASIYVLDGNSNTIYESEKVELTAGKWEEISFRIPSLEGACIEQAGFKVIPKEGRDSTIVLYIDNFDFLGSPSYTLDFNKERMERWHNNRLEVSQFTYLKGYWILENGELSGSCADRGEAYTGAYDWKDYSFEATMIPRIGHKHMLNFRVQGAIRSYAVGLSKDNELVLYKNDNGYREIAKVPFNWEHYKEYRLKIKLVGNKITIIHDGQAVIEYTDTESPYLTGQIGASVHEGSRCHYKDFVIQGIE